MPGLPDFETAWRQATLDTMTEETRRQITVYQGKQKFVKGDVIPVPNQEWFAPDDCQLIFVDLVPRANWGHPCRYLLLKEEGAEVLEIREWEFPPSADSVKLLYKGEAVEDWMVLGG